MKTSKKPKRPEVRKMTPCMEQWTDAVGQTFMIHPKELCRGPCAIHNPSVHHMAGYPLIMRESTLLERRCPHGVGHPDPDSLAYFNKIGKNNAYEVHGCDGCCSNGLDKLDFSNPYNYTPEAKLKRQAEIEAKIKNQLDAIRPKLRPTPALASDLHNLVKEFNKQKIKNAIRALEDVLPNIDNVGDKALATQLIERLKKGL